MFEHNMAQYPSNYLIIKVMENMTNRVPFYQTFEFWVLKKNVNIMKIIKKPEKVQQCLSIFYEELGHHVNLCHAGFQWCMKMYTIYIYIDIGISHSSRININSWTLSSPQRKSSSTNTIIFLGSSKAFDGNSKPFDVLILRILPQNFPQKLLMLLLPVLWSLFMSLLEMPRQDFTTPKKISSEPRKKKLLLSIESWLVNRDPYHGFLLIPTYLGRISLLIQDSLLLCPLATDDLPVKV